MIKKTDWNGISMGIEKEFGKLRDDFTKAIGRVSKI